VMESQQRGRSNKYVSSITKKTQVRARDDLFQPPLSSNADGQHPILDNDCFGREHAQLLTITDQYGATT